MRISTLLSLLAVLTGGLVTIAPAYAAEEQSCHFLPLSDSTAGLQHGQSVGVLYSENTLNTLQYLEQYHAVALKGAKSAGLDSRISNAFINSSDPALAINWLKDSLQKQFASVTVYDNLDALVQARPDVVVMLDTYSSLVTQRNTHVEARFLAKFYDSNLQYIGKAEGSSGKQLSSIWVHGKAAPEIAAQIDQQRDLQVDALKKFDASLKAFVTSNEVARLATK
ncbi:MULTISPECIES: ATPase [unclassified Pseudomonas]|uniref:ATPase n=1 Tax=unclassified Pseudomonas TaxID=196821 RepID=UPI002AC9E0C2|nr:MULTISPECIES: ATPase [unclassified Pseudomonas]MEB0045612.1 ATPase [Pseudomonas sp. Dout3]MEB0095495.1 ATPase [Pseudomonas sp. DC1.2]WPX61077.1 ATPase [Pseudomonas sp. DC1.2]